MKVLVLSHMYPSTFNEVAGIFVHEAGEGVDEERRGDYSSLPRTVGSVSRLIG